jgi:pentapeptide MXKDX repeat protein
MNKAMQTLTAAVLAFALLSPAAWAGDKQKPNAADAQSINHGQMSHGQMNHGQMDHSQMQNMDHSKMQGMDHSKMNHGAMQQGHDGKPKTDRKDDQ